MAMGLAENAEHGRWPLETLPRSEEGAAMPVIPRIRVAAIVRNERGQILLVRHFHRGSPFWTLPGGAPNEMETLDAAVVREVLEETRYHVTVDGVLGIGSLQTDRWEPPKVEVFFAGRLLERERDAASSPRFGESIMEARCFDEAALPAEFRPREAVAFLNRGAVVPYLTLAPAEFEA